MTEQEIEREVERYMALPYRVELTPDDDGWFVRIPDLPYCMSQGDTVEEAMEMIRDAQRGWLAVRLQKALPIPAPSTPSYDDSGAFDMRTPKHGEARAVSARFADDLLYVRLEDGREIGAPIVWFPRLYAATPEQRDNWEVIGRGVGLHWPDVDEDLSVAGLLETESNNNIRRGREEITPYKHVREPEDMTGEPAKVLPHRL